MRVGLEAFTIREVSVDPFAQLDFAKAHGFEGMAFDEIGYIGMNKDQATAQAGGEIPKAGLEAVTSLDIGRMKAVRAYADELKLYSYVSVSSCNPLFLSRETHDVADMLRPQVEALAEAGWHELRSTMGGVDERFNHPVPWQKHLKASAEVIRLLKPVLRACKSRINLETHGESTTFELARMAEDLGPDIAGITLDTANVLVHAENPVMAAQRAAPYTHLTHAKDAIIYLSNKGFTRQGRPAGEGIVEWERLIPILYNANPDLPLSVEDHKWLFEVPVFDESWHAGHEELSARELATVFKLAASTSQKIAEGLIPNPEDYERIPYQDQMMDRLYRARDYLKGIVSTCATESPA